MINEIINKIKGWWHKMFDYNKIISDFGLDMQTSKNILDAIQEWNKIYNKCEPWLDDNTKSLHVARTMCEKVAKAVTVEYKSTCSEPYIDNIYQKLLKKKRKYTESMLGKSLIFFRPYFDGKNITPVTGFSISGNLNEDRSKFKLSDEVETRNTYRGPKYILIENMTINN